jgi:hypothetical protein
MFQQDGTFCTLFYSLKTALHVSGETFTHHQELEQTVVHIHDFRDNALILLAGI